MRAIRRLTFNKGWCTSQSCPWRYLQSVKVAIARNTSFNIQCKLEYGLKVVGKDTKTDKIDLVACRFCLTYGADEKVGAKRQKTDCKKTFVPQFCSGSNRSHFTLYHPTK
uniref:Uncharacterized protein n=1 Tax=Hyaloperonospora arabidopsidis (strain Emoy2) TaxID=559515 RepID=M4BIU6_HYAAE